MRIYLMLEDFASYLYADAAFERSTLEAQGMRTESTFLSDFSTPFQGVIMKYEFKAHLEEYLRTSSASRKTLQEIVEYYETNPETMMKYGCTLLKASLEETPGGLQGTEYLNAMEERSKMMVSVREALADYDAVIVGGPTNIMHFCGLPSVTIAGSQTNLFGVRRGLMLYGVDEYRLYRAALAIERIIRG